MEIVDSILEWKEKRNAVILAHNYQLPEVQDIADFTGDSLGLSVEAAKTKADVIVFCGVYFMAETAKILSPQKTVVIPDKNAGCPMADMITADELRELKRKNPDAITVCYVNTSAEVKAECDVCCTSANAVDMLNELKKTGRKIIFVPDKYLGSYSSKKTGCEVILWQGYCPTHALMLPEHVLKMKEKYPAAEVLVHPECNGAMIDLADAVLSTSGMLNYVKRSKANEFIIGTENGMLYPLQKENPGKKFYPVSDMAVCPNMKKTTLDKVLNSLQTLKHEVVLPEEIILKARKSIDRMINGIDPDNI
jgi:quinolinate synthase